MANNYEQSTVNPILSNGLFTDTELEVLASFGMHYEPAAEFFYFYSEEPGYGGDFEIMPKSYKTICHEAEQGNYVATQLLDYITAEALNNEAESNGITINFEDINDDADIDTELTVETVFQSILRKRDCTENEIVIMGAFTCSKMRQGEFGGFVTRITRDSIQHSGTYQMLEEMRHPEKKQLAVVMQGGLIQAVVSHQPENLEVISIDYDTEGYDESDLTRVKQSDGSYSQAYCVNECIQEPVIDLNQVITSMNAIRETWVIRKNDADNKRKENQNVG